MQNPFGFISEDNPKDRKMKRFGSTKQLAVEEANLRKNSVKNFISFCKFLNQREMKQLVQVLHKRFALEEILLSVLQYFGCIIYKQRIQK